MTSLLRRQVDALRADVTGTSSGYLQRQKGRASLLHSPDEAADISLESVWNNAISGLQGLRRSEPRLEEYEITLFSKDAMRSPRELQTKAVNDACDKSIGKFLQLLSPLFNQRSAHLVMEYLIRHYCVYQYNVDALMGCMLPWHDTRSFVRIVQLIDLKSGDARWNFLSKVATSGTPPHRSTISSAAARDMALLDFICKSSVSSAESSQNDSQRTQGPPPPSFFAAVCVEAMDSLRSIHESFVRCIVPHVLRGVGVQTAPQLQMACYMITAKLVSRAPLSPAVLSTLITSISRSPCAGSMEQPLLCLIAITQAQGKQQLQAPGSHDSVPGDSHKKTSENSQNFPSLLSVEAFVSLAAHDDLSDILCGLRSEYDTSGLLTLLIHRAVCLLGESKNKNAHDLAVKLLVAFGCQSSPPWPDNSFSVHVSWIVENVLLMVAKGAMSGPRKGKGKAYLLGGCTSVLSTLTNSFPGESDEGVARGLCTAAQMGSSACTAVGDFLQTALVKSGLAHHQPLTIQAQKEGVGVPISSSTSSASLLTSLSDRSSAVRIQAITALAGAVAKNPEAFSLGSGDVSTALCHRLLIEDDPKVVCALTSSPKLINYMAQASNDNTHNSSGLLASSASSALLRWGGLLQSYKSNNTSNTNIKESVIEPLVGVLNAASSICTCINSPMPVHLVASILEILPGPGLLSSMQNSKFSSKFAKKVAQESIKVAAAAGRAGCHLFAGFQDLKFDGKTEEIPDAVTATTKALAQSLEGAESHGFDMQACLKLLSTWGRDTLFDAYLLESRTNPSIAKTFTKILLSELTVDNITGPGATFEVEDSGESPAMFERKVTALGYLEKIIPVLGGDNGENRRRMSLFADDHLSDSTSDDFDPPSAILQALLMLYYTNTSSITNTNAITKSKSEEESTHTMDNMVVEGEGMGTLPYQKALYLLSVHHYSLRLLPALVAIGSKAITQGADSGLSVAALGTASAYVEGISSTLTPENDKNNSKDMDTVQHVYDDIIACMPLIIATLASPDQTVRDAALTLLNAVSTIQPQDTMIHTSTPHKKKKKQQPASSSAKKTDNGKINSNTDVYYPNTKETGNTSTPLPPLENLEFSGALSLVNYLCSTACTDALQEPLGAKRCFSALFGENLAGKALRIAAVETTDLLQTDVIATHLLSHACRLAERSPSAARVLFDYCSLAPASVRWPFAWAPLTTRLSHNSTVVTTVDSLHSNEDSDLYVMLLGIAGEILSVSVPPAQSSAFDILNRSLAGNGGSAVQMKALDMLISGVCAKAIDDERRCALLPTLLLAHYHSGCEGVPPASIPKAISALAPTPTLLSSIITCVKDAVPEERSSKEQNGDDQEHSAKNGEFSGMNGSVPSAVKGKKGSKKVESGGGEGVAKILVAGAKGDAVAVLTTIAECISAGAIGISAHVPGDSPGLHVVCKSLLECLVPISLLSADYCLTTVLDAIAVVIQAAAGQGFNSKKSDWSANTAAEGVTLVARALRGRNCSLQAKASGLSLLRVMAETYPHAMANKLKDVLEVLTDYGPASDEMETLSYHLTTQMVSHILPPLCQSTPPHPNSKVTQLPGPSLTSYQVASAVIGAVYRTPNHLRVPLLGALYDALEGGGRGLAVTELALLTDTTSSNEQAASELAHTLSTKCSPADQICSLNIITSCALRLALYAADHARNNKDSGEDSRPKTLQAAMESTAEQGGCGDNYLEYILIEGYSSASDPTGTGTTSKEHASGDDVMDVEVEENGSSLAKEVGTFHILDVTALLRGGEKDEALARADQLLKFALDTLQSKILHRQIATATSSNAAPGGDAGESPLQTDFLLLCEGLLQLLQVLTTCQGVVEHHDDEDTKRWSGIRTIAYDMLETLQSLLSVPSFVAVIQELLHHEDPRLRQKALQMLNKRMQSLEERGGRNHSGGPTIKLREAERSLFLEMVPDLLDMVAEKEAEDEQESSSTRETALLSLHVLSITFGASHPTPFQTALKTVAHTAAASTQRLLHSQTSKHSPGDSKMDQDAVLTPSAQKKSAKKSAKKAILEAGKPVTELISSEKLSLCSCSFMCVASIVSVLGARAFPQLPVFFPAMMEALEYAVLKQEQQASTLSTSISASLCLLQQSCLSSSAAVATCLPQFIHPYVSRLLKSTLRENLLQDTRTRPYVNRLLGAVAKAVPPRLLLPVVMDTLTHTQNSTNIKHIDGVDNMIEDEESMNGVSEISDKWSGLCGIAAERLHEFVGEAITALSRDALVTHLDDITSYFLTAFEYRSGGGPSPDSVDTATTSALLTLTLRLNEPQLRTLFDRLCGWAQQSAAASTDVTTSTSTDVTHAYVLISRYTSLLIATKTLGGTLRSIFVPYYEELWPAAVTILTSVTVSATDGAKPPSAKKRKKSSSAAADGTGGALGLALNTLKSEDAASTTLLPLCRHVVECLDLCFKHDRNGFVDSTKYDGIMTPLIDQLDAVILQDEQEENLKSYTMEAVAPCLAHLASAVNNDVMWKPLVQNIFIKTRNTNPAVRLAALRSIELCFSTVGEDFLAVLPDSLPFLSELMEDEDPEVEGVTHRLIKYIEDVLGESVESYLS